MRPAMPVLARARQGSLWLLSRWSRVVAVLLAVLGALLGGGLLVAWLGLYNVAASEGHLAVTERLLHFGMVNSVRARAPSASPRNLGDEALVTLGAAHFHSGCAHCHGTPGSPVDPVSLGMLPAPPDLGEKVGEWSDGELFWIVKHGLKYTGMPGWPVTERDDEVWAVVAFLRRLPDLDRAGYLRLARGEVEEQPAAGSEIVKGEGDAGAVSACARCHGAEHPPPSELVPRLNGQPRTMLETALRNYAARRRPSGIMQAAAAGLSAEEIRKLAAYYASLPPLPAPLSAADPALIARGERLAREGDEQRDIPACLSCHRTDGRPDTPRLAGQTARYLAGQLRLWQEGLNAASPTAALMAPIARRLSASQIAEVSAYFASRPAEAERPGAPR